MYNVSGISLNLESIRFPNGIFDLGLYKGKRIIDELYVKSSFIEKLLADDSGLMETLLNNLKTLRFRNCIIVNLNEHSFYYIMILRQVYIYETEIIHFHSFLRSDMALEELEIDRLPDDIDLNDLLVSNVHRSLRMLTIRSFSPKFHHLAAANFSMLNGIKEINLDACGIRTIEKDTFVNVYDTLERLKLCDNSLTVIHFAMFYPLFEHISGTEIFVDLRNNSFQCSCDYYEYETVVGWSYRNLYCPTAVTKCTGLDISTLQCPALQPIDFRKLCFGKSEANNNFNYYFPKFVLKSIDASQSVVIKAFVSRKYRLWAHNLMDPSEFNAKWGYTPQKCPSTTFVRVSTRCFLFSSTTESVPLSVFKGLTDSFPSMTQFCVNFVSTGAKRMWPMHCITVNQRRSTENRPDFTHFVYGGGICLMIAVIFIVVSFANRKSSMPEETKDKKCSNAYTVEAVDQFNDINDYESIMYSSPEYCAVLADTSVYNDLYQRTRKAS